MTGADSKSEKISTSVSRHRSEVNIYTHNETQKVQRKHKKNKLNKKATRGRGRQRFRFNMCKMKPA